MATIRSPSARIYSLLKADPAGNCQYVDSGGVRKVLDTVISHPIAHSEPCVADTPDIAAYIAALKKENLQVACSTRSIQ